jgi:hypothetical protein
MAKYKCLKLECPLCHKTGSAQLFLRKDSTIKYARVRHYSHIDKDSKKPQFTYCKIENLDTFKAQLPKNFTSKINVDLSLDHTLDQNQFIDDHKLKDSSFNQQNKQCLGSLAWWGVTLVR